MYFKANIAHGRTRLPSPAVESRLHIVLGSSSWPESYKYVLGQFRVLHEDSLFIKQKLINKTKCRNIDFDKN